MNGSAGLTLGASDTLLTARAADFLAAGPADSQSLISHVCQLPGAPPNIAGSYCERLEIAIRFQLLI